MKTTLQVLIDARAKIATRDKWKQGVFEDRNRNDPGCRFCAMGAVYAALDQNYCEKAVHPAFFALAASANVETPGAISMLNDDPDTTHADVLSIFDKAIEAERAKVAS